MDVRPHRQGFKKLLYHQGSEFKKIQAIQDHTMSPAIKKSTKVKLWVSVRKCVAIKLCVLEFKRNPFCIYLIFTLQCIIKV